MTIENDIKLLNCNCKCHPINSYEPNGCNNIEFLLDLSRRFHRKIDDCNCDCNNKSKKNNEEDDWEDEEYEQA